MSRQCSINPKKKTLVGNKVSHSHRKTKRQFLPNLHNFTFKSELMNRCYRLKMTVSSMRSIMNKDGLDNYLKSTRNKDLSKAAILIKKTITKEMSLASKTTN